ncbi:MAG: Right-handed parallel beta-helix repeat-containing protein, partial [Candidatus Hydrogenedentes bacterium]|nr:Right-handed parallel beta-helix repeat-containing protein [Candidatus Hydrogenedentota bacterium]
MNMRTFVLALSMAAIATFSALAADVTLYVSPLGNDADGGTPEAPFRTLAHAQEAARELDADSSVTVCLMDGVFTLTEPWRLDARDSGVVYKAAPDAKPVISSGRTVGGWIPDEGGRWRANVDIVDMRHLYVNGKRAIRARGPAPEGIERYGDLIFIDGDAGHIFPDSAMASWRNPSEIELGYYNSWAHMICKVKSITPEDGRARVSMLQPWFMLASRKEGVRIDTPAYIENALELLDEPGEWYFDKPARVLYYLPREGEDMNDAAVTVPLLETLVEIRGTVENPAGDIRFEGITFADATWLSPNRIGHIDEQANFTFSDKDIFERDGCLVNMHNHYIKSPANVVVHAARGIQFERCTFTRLGGAGLDIECGARNNLVSHCEFFDISGSAIQIGDVLEPD